MRNFLFHVTKFKLKRNYENFKLKFGKNLKMFAYNMQNEQNFFECSKKFDLKNLQRCAALIFVWCEKADTKMVNHLRKMAIIQTMKYDTNF